MVPGSPIQTLHPLNDDGANHHSLASPSNPQRKARSINQKIKNAKIYQSAFEMVSGSNQHGASFQNQNGKAGVSPGNFRSTAGSSEDSHGAQAQAPGGARLQRMGNYPPSAGSTGTSQLKFNS